MWKNLLDGVSGAAPITHFDSSKCKTHFACEVKNLDINEWIDRKEARKLDRYTQIAMISAMQAVNDSGMDLEKVDKNRIGVGLAKGNDVTSAVQKAERRAKKNMITFNMNKDTICHEVETKVTGAHVLMKPAAPGTGIIAGGVVRSIIGLTGIKNLISKSLGSTNKANIAYAVIEGLRQQVPKAEWNGSKKAEKAEKPAKSTKKETK